MAASLLALAGCKDPATTAAVPVASPALAPPPEVEITGCAETLRTPATCRIADKAEIHLWVAGQAEPEITLASGRTPDQRRVRDPSGGTKIAMTIRPDDTGLTVTVPGSEAWSLAIASRSPTPRADAAREAVLAAKDTNDVKAALAQLERDAAQMQTHERVAAEQVRMQLLFQVGDVASARAVGERALDLALEHGRVSAAIDIAQPLAFNLLVNGDEARARWVIELERLHQPLELDAGRLAASHYYRGLLAQHAGDLREALVELETAEAIAGRVDDDSFELAAASWRVTLLAALGRTKEQPDFVGHLLDIVHTRPNDRRCEDAQHLSNAAWAIMSAPAGSSRDDATRLLETALGFFEPGEGCDPERHPHARGTREDVRLSLAFCALASGSADRMRSHLDAVRPEALLTGMPAWLELARAELALLEGDPRDALAHAETAGTKPGGALVDPRLPWRLAMLQGRAHLLAGDDAQALDAFRRAEERVDEVMAAVGVDQGRESLARALHASADAVVRLLVAEGDVDSAATLARRARSRAFRPIGRNARLASLPADDRERWQRELAAYRDSSQRIARELAEAWTFSEAERDVVLREHALLRRQMREHLDEAYALLDKAPTAGPPVLQRPGKGELWLLYWPGEAAAGHGLAFAITQTTIRAHAIDPIAQDASPDAIAERLLSPFAADIDEAQSLRLLPTGALLDVDFATLPWKGDILVATLPIAWSLDLPRESETAARPIARALVVGDPATHVAGLGRLPQARAEAESVAEALGAHGLTVDILTGESATHDAVVDGLARVDVLHWAGHGLRGAHGWESRLPLAGEAALDVRDVLALPSVPRLVVLSGCETGRTDREEAAGGMHLAAAFLAAGAQSVIAAARQVDDATAAAFGLALHSQALAGDVDGPARVRAAALALRKAGRDDWTAFRAWTP